MFAWLAQSLLGLLAGSNANNDMATFFLDNKVFSAVKLNMYDNF